jgi:hypothetical protein
VEERLAVAPPSPVQEARTRLGGLFRRRRTR